MADLTDDERASATDAVFLPRMPHGYADDYGAMSEDAKEWLDFIEEMGDAIQYAKITVYRVPVNASGMPQKRQMAFLFECAVDEFTYSQLCGKIQDDFGTGVYRIQVRDKEGKLRRNKSIAIEAPKGKELQPNGSHSAGDVIDRMARAMAEQQDRFEHLLTRLTGREVDPLDQMTRMAGAMAAMMEAMGVKNTVQAQQPKTLIEQLTEFKMLKELLNDGDGGGSVDNFWGLLAETAKSLGGPLMMAISQAQENGQMDQRGVIQRRQLPEPQKEPETVETSLNADEVKPQLTFLLTQAKAKVPPAEVVSFIMNALPDDGDAHESLEAFLERESCIQECTAIMPEIASERAWFGEWRGLMLKELALFFDDGGEDLTDGEPPDNNHGSEAGEASEQTGAASGEPASTGDVGGNTAGSGGN